MNPVDPLKMASAAVSPKHFILHKLQGSAKHVKIHIRLLYNVKKHKVSCSVEGQRGRGLLQRILKKILKVLNSIQASLLT